MRCKISQRSESNMELVDKDLDLKCVDCGASFVFSAAEQSFFREKGFSDPKRCKPCQALRANGKRRPRPQTAVRCATCGQNTTVPFVPRRNEPVLCRECYLNRRKVVPIHEDLCKERAFSKAAPRDNSNDIR